MIVSRPLDATQPGDILTPDMSLECRARRVYHSRLRVSRGCSALLRHAFFLAQYDFV
jgi:hypothetical protein